MIPSHLWEEEQSHFKVWRLRTKLQKSDNENCCYLGENFSLFLPFLCHNFLRACVRNYTFVLFGFFFSCGEALCSRRSHVLLLILVLHLLQPLLESFKMSKCSNFQSFHNFKNFRNCQIFNLGSILKIFM